MSIETGRYDGKNRNERECILCIQSVCESEYHFFLCCPLHKVLRNMYNMTSFWPNFNVFTNTLSNYNTPLIVNLAKLHEAFILRQDMSNISAAS